MINLTLVLRSLKGVKGRFYVMASDLILDANSENWHRPRPTPSSFFALAFYIELKYRDVDVRVNISDGPSASYIEMHWIAVQ